MKRTVEVIKDGSPVAISTSVALVHDNEVEVITRVLLVNPTPIRRHCVERLIDSEMNITPERNVAVHHNTATLPESPELVVRLVPQTDSVRNEENALEVPARKELVHNIEGDECLTRTGCKRKQGSVPSDEHLFNGGSNCALLVIPHRRHTRQAERGLQQWILGDLTAVTCHCLTAPRLVGLPTLEKLAGCRKNL